MKPSALALTILLLGATSAAARGEDLGLWSPQFYFGMEAVGSVTRVPDACKGKADAFRLAWESGAKTFGIRREAKTELKGAVDWTVEAFIKCEGNHAAAGAAIAYFDGEGRPLGRVAANRPAEALDWRKISWSFTTPKEARRFEVHLLSLDRDPLLVSPVSVTSRQGVDRGELPFETLAIPSEWNRDWNGGENRMTSFSDAPIPATFLLKGPREGRDGLKLVVDVPAELELKDACCPYRKAFEALKPVATPFVTNGSAFVRYAFAGAKVFGAFETSRFNADEALGIMLTIGPRAGGERMEKKFRVAYRLEQNGKRGAEKAMEIAFRPMPKGLRLAKDFPVFSWNSSDRHFASDAATLAAFRAYEAAGLATFRKTGNGSTAFARQKEITALLEKRPVRYLFSGRFGDVWIPGSCGLDKAKAAALGVRMAKMCNEKGGGSTGGRMCPEYFNNDPAFREHLRKRVHSVLADGRVASGDWVTFDMEPWHSLSWCHCEACHKAFAEYAGLDRVPTAKEILSPALVDTWANFRCRHNEKSVELLTKIIREYDPTLKCIDYDYVMPYGDEEGMRARRRACSKDTLANEKWLDGHLCSYYHLVDRESFAAMRNDRRYLKRDYVPLAAIAGAGGYLRPGEILTPRQIRQFALAAFVNGCRGYGFYAGVGYDGETLLAMMEAQDTVARYEGLPWGERAGTAAPKCASREFEFASTVRPDGTEVVALFNYDAEEPIEVTLGGKTYSLEPYGVRFVETAPSPAVCNCGVCPERTNDFVWENDKFGMRAYGPGEYHKWSGLDVFNKNTSSNVCLGWCHCTIPGNFHENRGFGMDNYTMGASRGVGGVAMFADGEWKTYPDWETCRVLHAGDDYLEFELVYPAFSAAGKMTYHVTLRRGERFYRNDVSFERMCGDFLVGPGIDLEPKRDHKGSLVEEPGLVSLFEDPKGKDGRDGSTMAAVFVMDPTLVTNLTDHLNCRVLAFRGQRKFTYFAGASWSLAGEITRPEQWHDEVRTFRDRLVPTGTVTPSEMKALRPHPRLFVDEGGFDALKAKLERTELGRLGREALLREAEALLALPPLKRKLEGIRLLAVSRSALDQIGKLAMAYRLTGRKDFARRAIDEALNVSRFKDWNHSHFLDTAEMTLAVALARDWLDDVLASAEKRELTEAIVKKGLLAADGRLPWGWWTRGANNWNQVCHAGLAAGAAAVREDYPAVAEAILLRAKRCLPYGLAEYAGGNFPEGPAAYWEYATDFTALAIDTLTRTVEGCEGLLKTDGLSAQTDYLDLMTGPTGVFFNYADAGITSESARRMFASPWWLARQFNRPDALVSWEIANFRRATAAAAKTARTRRSFDRMFPFLLLWLPESDIDEKSVSSSAALCQALQGENPLGVLRSGLGRDDWYVGVRGGSPTGSHAHMDAGSFVLEAGGVRWACDIGCEDYHRMEQSGKISLWDYRQDSTRWSLFRLGIDGHGTLVVDGARHNVDGRASVAVSGSRLTVDLTSLYPAAKSVVRTFELVKDKVTVSDRLSGLRPGATVTWNMNTCAKATVDGRVLKLGQKSADGRLRTLGAVANEGDAWEAFSIAEPRTPLDAPNPGVTRVRLARRAAADGTVAFDVAFSLAGK